jgi:hypothetical protein
MGFIEVDHPPIDGEGARDLAPEERRVVRHSGSALEGAAGSGRVEPARRTSDERR